MDILWKTPHFWQWEWLTNREDLPGIPLSLYSNRETMKNTRIWMLHCTLWALHYILHSPQPQSKTQIVILFEQPNPSVLCHCLSTRDVLLQCCTCCFSPAFPHTSFHLQAAGPCVFFSLLFIISVQLWGRRWFAVGRPSLLAMMSVLTCCKQWWRSEPGRQTCNLLVWLVSSFLCKVC